MTSLYFKNMDILSHQCSMGKLTAGEEMLPDPYDGSVRERLFKSSSSLWSPLQAVDGHVYMVKTICFYTREEFKSFKLTDGYNYFLSGKVSGLGALKAYSLVLLVATV